MSSSSFENNIVSQTGDESIVLVCAADNNYAMPLAVMVRSVLENLGSERELSLFIIDGGIKKHNKQKIVRSISSETIKLAWLQPPEGLLDKMEVSGYFTVAIYYRLFIPELLPQYKKAIYLDTDLIVNEDLGKLWDIDIGNSYLMAARPQYPSSQELSLKTEEEDCGGLKIDENYKNLNSGVLVFNLEKWRAEKIGIEIIKYLEKNKPFGRMWDQDGIALVLKDKWKELDSRWNQTPGIHDCASWENSSFTEQEFQQLVENPYIIHFANPGKPWNTIGRHPSQPLFYYYLDMTAWSGWRFTQWRRIARKLSRELRKSL